MLEEVVDVLFLLSESLSQGFFIHIGSHCVRFRNPCSLEQNFSMLMSSDDILMPGSPPSLASMKADARLRSSQDVLSRRGSRLGMPQAPLTGPTNKLKNFIIDYNRQMVAEYADPDNTLARRQYNANYPTRIAVLRCMDGRLDFPTLTKTPLGLIQSFQNLGGEFDIGWGYFGVLIMDFVNQTVANGNDCIILITYHFSKGDREKGCAGWNFDTAAAMEGAILSKSQVEYVFGKQHKVVMPILVGVETDEDALLFHGDDTSVTINLADVQPDAQHTLADRFEKVCVVRKRLCDRL
jgi:hypothetical protein